MFAPYCLASLLDMLQLPIGRVLVAYQKLASFSQVLALAHHEKAGPLKFRAHDYQVLVDRADEFCQICLDVSLVVTHGVAKEVCINIRRVRPIPEGVEFDGLAIGNMYTSLNVLMGCLNSEASMRAAMVLPPEKIALYEPTEPHFGSEARTKFPSAIYDIDEAAKCLALGRTTACVFHCMRVMETLLRAVFACLAAPPAGRNWGEVLTGIRTERQRRGAAWPEKEFFQEVYARLDAIKDAWRNTTMHVENIYTEEQARGIFDSTRAFTQKVASRMDEQGLPLA